VSSSTYGTLLRTPGAAAFFFTATVGRVGIAMTGLGLVWLVHGRTGSYTAAGLVTGSFAVAEAVVGPQVARLVDRLGQTRVLPPLLLAHAAAVAVLLALVNEGRPGWAMAAGGVLAGATIPQLGALSAARWSTLLLHDHATALPTAFSLESLSNGFAFLLGPVLVSAVAANGHPALGTVLAATLIVVGGLARVRPQPDHRVRAQDPVPVRGRPQDGWMTESMAPADRRTDQVGVTGRDDRDPAQPGDGVDAVLVQVAGRLPQQIALSGADQQPALADPHLGDGGDRVQVRFQELDDHAGLGGDLFVAGPPLSVRWESLPFICADRARPGGWVDGVGVLVAAPATHPDRHRPIPPRPRAGIKLVSPPAHGPARPPPTAAGPPGTRTRARRTPDCAPPAARPREGAAK